MKKNSALIPLMNVFAAMLIVVSIVTVTACKKEKEDDNNPVDLANCADYGSGSVAELTAFFSGCNKVWRSVNSDFEEYKSNHGTYFKFKDGGSLLYYEMYHIPANSYISYSIFEYNGEVVVKFPPFPMTDDLGGAHDTFRVNIVRKDKVELINITMKNTDGTDRKGRLGVYEGYLQKEFDNPPAPSSGGSGGGGSSSDCKSGYKDPTSDAQLNSYCGAAYTYQCLQGMSSTSSGVKYVCDAYETLKYSGAPACPYCP
jgi:hypothetical protein